MLLTATAYNAFQQLQCPGVVRPCTREVSNLLTTKDSIRPIANVPVSVPCIVPRAAVSATTCKHSAAVRPCLSAYDSVSSCCIGRLLQLTLEVWDEGMPPERMSCVKSHRPSECQLVTTLSNCAMAKATKAAQQGLPCKRVVSDMQTL